MSASDQTLAFQAETRELLNLMIHSLYTDKDIFLRELISNASDALDHLRFEALTNPDLLEGDNKFEIYLDLDSKAQTLTISDTGIGMSRKELIHNIGTIAKSRSLELREKGRRAAITERKPELIERFGVGFYSAFMVANKVTVLTRRAGEHIATEWESTGHSTYTIRESVKLNRGTSICLSLKPPVSEEGIGDYTIRWYLVTVIKKHSDYIGYPIFVKDKLEHVEQLAPSTSRRDDLFDIPTGDVPVNYMKPIWDRPQSEVRPEDHFEFYRHISRDGSDLLNVIHCRAEGLFEYKALLFIPQVAPYDLYYATPNMGVYLFAKRVMIMEMCQDLLPRYLRFIRGIVDVGDLPLNISCQHLQEDRHVNLIQKWLARRTLDTLREMLENDPDKYLSFWAEFGQAIKEGIGLDYDNRDRIISILLFQSSNDIEKPTSLKDYVGRMKPDQEQIFYLAGESRNLIEHSPLLEAVKDKGFEILYLVDAVDELLLQYLTKFNSKKLRSLEKGGISLATEEERKQIQTKPQQEQYKDLLEFLQRELHDYIKQVRLSERLISSPSCLVVEEHDFSLLMKHKLHRGKTGSIPRRVLELNPGHHLIVRLQKRHQENGEDPFLRDAADLLYGLALLAEGSELPDPIQFSHTASHILAQVI